MATKRRGNYFILSIIVITMLCTIIQPTADAIQEMVQKQIIVLIGADIYIDDVKLNLIDAKGNPVDVFIHNGTTYLPARAIAEAVGKSIIWDSDTNSVYIGNHNAVNKKNYDNENDLITNYDRIKITAEEVFDIYMKEYPETKIKEIQLDSTRDNSYIFEVEGFDTDKVYELKINPFNGNILYKTEKLEKETHKGFLKSDLYKVESLVNKALQAEGSGIYLDEWEIEIDDGRLILEIEIDKNGKDYVEYKYDLKTEELIIRKPKQE